MKLLLSVLLLAAVSVGFAQLQTASANQKAAQQAFGPGHYVGDLTAHKPPRQMFADACPLTLTSARLNWPAAYLPTSSVLKVTEPNLALGFQNASGRAIRSVAITAELKVKKDVYALDATPVEMRLNFAGTEDLNKTLDQLATIPLPQKMHSFGVVRVRLDQVTFADGGLWRAPAGANSCEVGSSGLLAAK